MTLTPSRQTTGPDEDAAQVAGPSAEWIAALALGLVVSGRDDDAAIEELLTAAHHSRQILTPARTRVPHVEAVDDEAARHAVGVLTSALDRSPGGEPAAGALP